MILQLNPPIPLDTPKGRGEAILVIDYSIEHSLFWTVLLNDTLECWTFPNRDVRAVPNYTIGRLSTISSRPVTPQPAL